MPVGTYLFELTYSSATWDIANAGGTYAHLVDEALSHIQIANDSEESLTISHHVRLGDLMDLPYEGCYHMEPSQHALAAWITSVAATPDLSLSRSVDKKPLQRTEMTTDNRITIYGDKETAG